MLQHIIALDDEGKSGVAADGSAGMREKRHGQAPEGPRAPNVLRTWPYAQAFNGCGTGLQRDVCPSHRQPSPRGHSDRVRSWSRLVTQPISWRAA